MSRKMKERKSRKFTQWISLPLLPLVVIGGYFWPYFGFAAIALIFLFLMLSPFRGRKYCGWICPMGSFHERVLSLVSLNRSMPSFFKRAWFKWFVFVALMSFLGYRLWLTGGNELQVASVFRMMWLISTSAAILIGLFYKPRSWCRFCPMGSLQGIIGKTTYRVKVGEACRQCGLCEKACPIEIYPGSYKDEGYVDGADCMRCLKCVDNCPKKALSIREVPQEDRCEIKSECAISPQEDASPSVDMDEEVQRRAEPEIVGV